MPAPRVAAVSEGIAALLLAVGAVVAVPELVTVPDQLEPVVLREHLVAVCQNVPIPPANP